jgi:hypothetical protein
MVGSLISCVQIVKVPCKVCTGTLLFHNQFDLARDNNIKDVLFESLTSMQSYRQQQRLLLLDFITVNDYLYLLRDISRELGRCLGNRAMWYLAAAVSDFHVPAQKLVRSFCCIGLLRSTGIHTHIYIYIYIYVYIKHKVLMIKEVM